MRRKFAVPVLFAIFLMSSGCSYLFMEKPSPGTDPVPRGYCTRSILAPAADVYGAVGSLGFVALATEDEGITSEEIPAAVIFSALSAGATYSAIRGFGWSRECKRRNALSEQAILDHLRMASDRIAEERSGVAAPATGRRWESRIDVPR